MKSVLVAITAAMVMGISGCAVETAGSARVAVGVIPNIEGMNENDALHALQEAGPWGYVLREVPSEAVPAGHVVNFGPPAGTRLPLNHPLGVTVSSGPAPT